MSTMLHALGSLCFRARGWVVIGWALVLAALLGIGLLVGTGTTNTYTFPGTESQDALDSLSRTFPQFAGTSAQLVAVAPSGTDVTDADFESAVESAITEIGKIPQVSSVTSPYSSTSTADISGDGSAVLVPIQLSVPTVDVLPSTADALQKQGRDLQEALPSGSEVSVGGQLFSQVNPGIGISEVSGLAIALVVLLFTFGTFIAAGMPIVTAVVGVGTSVAIVLAATRFVTVTSTGPLLAVMLGLAVGVDYALFILSRHQDQLRAGMPPEQSAPRAVATAGSAVVFAATTVIIALLGLSVAGIPFLTITGVAAALAVACAALVALTLTPALLSFAGWRMVRRRDRPNPAGESSDATDQEAPHGSDEHGIADGDATSDGDPSSDPDAASDEHAAPADPDGSAGPDVDAGSNQEDAGGSADSGDQPPAVPRGFFGRWVRVVAAWPPITVILVIAALGLLATPALHLRLALPDSGSLPEGSPGREAYDLIGEHFGAGYNGPLLVTGSVIQSTDPVALVDDIADRIRSIPGVASVPLATPNESGDTAIIQVIPEGAPDSVATEDLVQAIRALHQTFLDDYAVDLSVTGYTALGIDISQRLGDAMLPFGLLVIGLSLVLLAMVFRSIVVPVTAALGYALSIGAAFGITTLVFVDGWLAGPLNVAHVGSAISFMPIIVMGVLFGLAMDYEVFLVSRMREDYLHHAEPRAAVKRGFVASARVVTAAAIIMTAVFGGFIRNGEASIQPIALGLTAGVAIDAFVVRMTLIPAVLTWFGRYAWWFPRWMDRTLPRFDVEGEALGAEDRLAGWPEDEDRFALAADGLRLASDAASAPDVRVDYGDVLVVAGGTGHERRMLLLGLTGRAPLAAERAKVAGLVVSARAATIRARSAVAVLDPDADPVSSLAEACLAPAVVVAIDGADAVTDPAVRTELRDVLAEAGAASRAPGDRPLTVVIATSVAHRVGDLLPGGAAVHVLDLDGATSRADVPVGGA